MTESLLEARELHTYYGASHILHGVDFRIDAGETVGLMGRNGMGKSTLIRSMLGLVKPRDGEVRVRGSPMTGADPFRVARQGIAYVPEGRGIFPNLTVRENLVMAARAGVDGRRDWTYERALATFPRLAERLDHGGGQLSGGEQQMLTIGRALMTNPDLLILDEATEGLAPLIAREIWRIVGDIRAHGIATLIVDKNYRAVTAIADRNVILVKGRVVFEGASGELSRAAGRAASASRGLARQMPFVTVASQRLEYRRIGIARPGRPTLVFLHEGLGSVAMWRDFPGARRARDEARARSSIRAAGTAGPSRSRSREPSRYMHDEAERVLPEFLDRLAIDRPILIGHSDGGSIALIYAATAARPPAAVVTLAAHVLVEDISVASIADAKEKFQTTDVRTKLARHHADVDSVFWGWNRIWLSPEFRAWNIEDCLPRIACPVLAIQGEDDEYGTMEQMRRIGAKVGRCRAAQAPELPSFGAQGPARRRHRRHRALRRSRERMNPSDRRGSPVATHGMPTMNAPAPFEATEADPLPSLRSGGDRVLSAVLRADERAGRGLVQRGTRRRFRPVSHRGPARHPDGARRMRLHRAEHGRRDARFRSAVEKIGDSSLRLAVEAQGGRRGRACARRSSWCMHRSIPGARCRSRQSSGRSSRVRSLGL